MDGPRGGGGEGGEGELHAGAYNMLEGDIRYMLPAEDI